MKEKNRKDAKHSGNNVRVVSIIECITSRANVLRLTKRPVAPIM